MFQKSVIAGDDFNMRLFRQGVGLIPGIDEHMIKKMITTLRLTYNEILNGQSTTKNGFPWLLCTL